MEERYGFFLAEQLRHPARALPFGPAELEATVDALVDVLRGGLAAGTGTEPGRRAAESQ